MPPKAFTVSIPRNAQGDARPSSDGPRKENNIFHIDIIIEVADSEGANQVTIRQGALVITVCDGRSMRQGQPAHRHGLSTATAACTSTIRLPAAPANVHREAGLRPPQAGDNRTGGRSWAYTIKTAAQIDRTKLQALLHGVAFLKVFLEQGFFQANINTTDNKSYAARALANKILMERSGFKMTGEQWTVNDIFTFRIRTDDSAPQQVIKAVQTFAHAHRAYLVNQVVPATALFETSAATSMGGGVAKRPAAAPAPDGDPTRADGSVAAGPVWRRPAAASHSARKRPAAASSGRAPKRARRSHA